MLDFWYVVLIFATCGCLGFICGIAAAQPIKRAMAEQIFNEMSAHLLTMQKMESMRNDRGFRLGVGDPAAAGNVTPINRGFRID
jgi:hypothetical protein